MLTKLERLLDDFIDRQVAIAANKAGIFLTLLAIGLAGVIASPLIWLFSEGRNSYISALAFLTNITSPPILVGSFVILVFSSSEERSAR